MTRKHQGPKALQAESLSKSIPTAEQLSRDLLLTAKAIRIELADAAGFVDDLEAEARRVAKLGGGR